MLWVLPPALANCTRPPSPYSSSLLLCSFLVLYYTLERGPPEVSFNISPCKSSHRFRFVPFLHPHDEPQSSCRILGHRSVPHNSTNRQPESICERHYPLRERQLDPFQESREQHGRQWGRFRWVSPELDGCWRA